MSDMESIREDAKRDEWYDANSGQCPRCPGTIVRINHQPASRYEPGFEIWICEGEFGTNGCGYESESIGG